MKILQDFHSKFEVIEYKLYESKFWIWSLRPHQATLGSGILSLKRECATFAELKQEEYCDFINIINVIEVTLKREFDYDAINYLMLMMMDKHVHFHVFPRYENPLEILGSTWNDYKWPAVPELVGESFPDVKLMEIVALIKSRI